MGLFTFFKKFKNEKFDNSKSGSPTIKNLYIQLSSSKKNDRLTVSKEIHNLINGNDALMLLKIDKTFREGYQYDWMNNWKNINPKDLLHQDLTTDEIISILGISSFHPNGYVREKAINSLAGIESPRVIPFLIFRLNDWVNQVKKAAQKSLLKYFDVKYYSSFIDCLPIFLSIKEKGKNDNIINQIINMLASEPELRSLKEGLTSKRSVIRLACYKVILQKNLIDIQKIMESLKLDTDSYIRHYVIKLLTKEMSIEEFIKITEPFLNDKYAKIRYLIMERILSSKHEKSIKMIERALFDDNRTIRELGRFYSSLQINHNFIEEYKEALQNNKDIYASICSIGEVGKKEDITYIEKYLNSDKIRFVNATLCSIAKLDFENNKEKIITFLSDQREGVSRTAFRLLFKVINDNDAERIYIIYKETNFNHVKINCCKLLCSLSKWTALIYILEFYTNENETISKKSKIALVKWIMQYNRSFVNPTKEQKEIIFKSLEKYGNALEIDVNFIYFSINSYL